jgi:hypothetical protein
LRFEWSVALWMPPGLPCVLAVLLLGVACIAQQLVRSPETKKVGQVVLPAQLMTAPAFSQPVDQSELLRLKEPPKLRGQKQVQVQAQATTMLVFATRL